MLKKYKPFIIAAVFLAVTFSSSRAGQMLELSSAQVPVMLKGVIIDPGNPFKCDFLVDSGHSVLKGEALKPESMKLIKYFLAALTMPEEDMWVNLSPYEKNRIIPESFGQTAMGRDLLAQDYILKQLTASLTYPEKEIGRKFWDKIYAQTKGKFGASDIPVNTFNKVWIVPDKAKVYEHNNGAFVVESRLKVMLEEDYLAMHKYADTSPIKDSSAGAEASQVVREIILPELEREVNEGSHFANLRQIYQAMVLAAWYKIRMKESLLGRLYVNQHKTNGIAIDDTKANEKIYQQYLKAFKKGIYNYIKEEADPSTGEILPRKYISGGFGNDLVSGRKLEILNGPDAAMQVLQQDNGHMVRHEVDIRPSLRSDPMPSRRHYVKSVYNFFLNVKPQRHKGPPYHVLTIREVFDMSLTKREENKLLARLKQPGSAGILMHEGLIKAVDSSHTNVRLFGQDGVAFYKSVKVTDGVMALLDDAPTEFPAQQLRAVSPESSVRVFVTGIFRIKIGDSYVLLVERNALKPIGGAMEFLNKSAYADFEMRSLKAPWELRQAMRADQVEDFVKTFAWSEAQEREPNREGNPRREFIEEVLGSRSLYKLFSQMPQSWQSVRSPMSNATSKRKLVKEDLEGFRQRLAQLPPDVPADHRAYLERVIKRFVSLRSAITDDAQAAGADPVGGIDMNAGNLDLSITRGGEGLVLPAQFEAFALGRGEIESVNPVILKVSPLGEAELHKLLTNALQ